MGQICVTQKAKQHARGLSAVITVRCTSAFNYERKPVSAPLCVYERMRNWAHIDVSDITNKTSPERFWSDRNFNPLQSCSQILNRLQKYLAEIHTGRLGMHDSGSQVVKRSDDNWFEIIAEPICILTGSFQSSAETQYADPQPFFNQINWMHNTALCTNPHVAPSQQATQHSKVRYGWSLDYKLIAVTLLCSFSVCVSVFFNLSLPFPLLLYTITQRGQSCFLTHFPHVYTGNLFSNQHPSTSASL